MKEEIEVAKYVIGLDNGGTSTKAAIFDLSGASSTLRYLIRILS